MHTEIRTQAATHIEIANIALQVVTIAMIGLFTLAEAVRFAAHFA